ncbi:MAG TPA: glycosyltransferase [Bacteroidia bacterium]|nr:glycosyltransferase [Bacteroidia bacterium]
MKTVLIICSSDHHSEPRLLMQCNALRSEFKIVTAGLSPVNDNRIGFIKLQGTESKRYINFHHQLPSFLRFPFTLINKIIFSISGDNPFYSGSDLRKLEKTRPDLVISHHPPALPIAIQLKNNLKVPVIFNAHEIYAFEFEDDKEWMKSQSEKIDAELKKHLPQCSALFTVNAEIADFYSKRYNCKAIVVHNSKPYTSIPPSKNNGKIRIIHHGGAMPQRKLEEIAEAILLESEKFELTFMLKPTDENYLRSLKDKYSSKGVIFKDPVPYEMIIETINQYDIGIHLLPEGNINHEFALPNKIFEFVQAKLAVITSPNTSLKNLIVSNDIGMVFEGYTSSSIVKLLKTIDREKVMHFKEQCVRSAEKLSSEKDESRILQTVKEILN